MDLLDKYKKAWENQPEDDQKVSKVDIYRMTKLRSSSIVKWIFIIGLMEFALLAFLNILISKTSYIEVYSKLNMITFLNYSHYINIFVVLIFLYLFYRNYVSINTTDNTKSLMSKIIKTRKTVKYYVFYNILGGLLVMIIFNLIIFNTPNGIEMLMPDEAAKINDQSNLTTIFIISQTIVVIITFAFLALFYYWADGICSMECFKHYDI